MEKINAKPADILSLSAEELACLQAAAKSFDAIAPKINISGHSGEPSDNRIYARHLLRDILHDKYDECVAASAPATPRQSTSQHR